MSGSNQPIQTSIELETSIDGSTQQGFATLYITLQNADGTNPILAIADGQPGQLVQLVQPTPNPGADPDFPVDAYPFVASINATAGDGSTVVNLIGNAGAGIVNQIFNVTVIQRIPQTALVPAAGIVVSPPG
jgi:hypothetical protein